MTDIDSPALIPLSLGMAKVYVLMGCEPYYGGEPIAVFADQVKAAAALVRCNDHYASRPSDYDNIPGEAAQKSLEGYREWIEKAPFGVEYSEYDVVEVELL